MPVVIDHRPGKQITPPAARQRRDPAPSRLKYRLERMWLTPLYRRVLRVGLPAFAIAMIGGLWLADEDRRAALNDTVASVVTKVQSRDEFQVRIMTIEGATPVVDRALRAMLPVDLPASSFDIDLAALRLQVLQLDAVESIDLRIRPGGILSAVVKEREPAILWRHARGIDMLDAGGHRVASLTSREVRADLPLITGEGADLATTEALALFDASGPILPRVRGLVRRCRKRAAQLQRRRHGAGVVQHPVAGNQPRGAVQPHCLPAFCCFSQVCSGAKYSSTAEASIFSPPVSSFMVCCHGWLAPLDNIAQ